MFKSIRLKLTAWYSLVLLAALGAFGIIAYFYTSENLLANLDISLRGEAEWLKDIVEGRHLGKYNPKSENLREEFLDSQASDDTSLQAFEQGESAEDYEIWNRIYEHTLLNAKKQFVYIFDRRGRTFYKSYNLGKDSLSSPADLPLNEVTISKSSLGGKVILLASLNTRLYRIRVAYPEDEVTDVLKSLFSIFLFLIPIVPAYLDIWRVLPCEAVSQASGRDHSDRKKNHGNEFTRTHSREKSARRDREVDRDAERYDRPPRGLV